jgi:hypothetical protein
MAAREASAIGYLRQLDQSLESYRKEHPQQGYPEILPKVSLAGRSVNPREIYEFHYIIWRSRPDGPFDGFLVQATPLWEARGCGYERSFTAADDGQIHFAYECRPATKTDPVVGAWNSQKPTSP